jgi:hypothetical protein
VSRNRCGKISSNVAKAIDQITAANLPADFPDGFCGIEPAVDLPSRQAEFDPPPAAQTRRRSKRKGFRHR